MSTMTTKRGNLGRTLARSARLLGLGLLWSAVLVGLQAAPVAPVLSALLNSEEEKSSSPLEEDEALPSRNPFRRAAGGRYPGPPLYRSPQIRRAMPGRAPDSDPAFSLGLPIENRPAGGLPLRC